MVVLISYGCMGRSARQDSTASASGLLTFRRAIAPPRTRLLDLEYPNSTTPRQAHNSTPLGQPQNAGHGPRSAGPAPVEPYRPRRAATGHAVSPVGRLARGHS